MIIDSGNFPASFSLETPNAYKRGTWARYERWTEKYKVVFGFEDLIISYTFYNMPATRNVKYGPYNPQGMSLPLSGGK